MTIGQFMTGLGCVLYVLLAAIAFWPQRNDTRPNNQEGND